MAMPKTKRMATTKMEAWDFAGARKAVLMKASVASVCSKPPRCRVGAAQSFLVMSVFAVATLAPAGWILHHLPEYRRRSRHRKPAN